MSDVTDMQAERWVASRYVVRSTDAQGNLILYSSYTGHMMKVAPDEAGLVRDALGKAGVAGPLTGILSVMQTGGFLVPARVDERRRAKLLHERWKARKETEQLIILSSEACNFRCVFCYETFERGNMTTNGYLLTYSVARRLAELGVRHYQITLDGPAADGRIRPGGGGQAHGAARRH